MITPITHYFRALWNAPLPVENHECLAVESAVQIVEKMHTMNNAWIQNQGYPEIKVKIGVASAKVFVGIIGHPERLSYTAIGDGVNIAARLSSLNSEYNTSILISDACHSKVQQSFACEHVDSVKLRGKNITMQVYQVLGRAAITSTQRAVVQ